MFEPNQNFSFWFQKNPPLSRSSASTHCIAALCIYFCYFSQSAIVYYIIICDHFLFWFRKNPPPSRSSASTHTHLLLYSYFKLTTFGLVHLICDHCSATFGRDNVLFNTEPKLMGFMWLNNVGSKQLYEKFNAVEWKSSKIIGNQCNVIIPLNEFLGYSNIINHEFFQVFISFYERSFSKFSFVSMRWAFWVFVSFFERSFFLQVSWVSIWGNFPSFLGLQWEELCWISA